MYDSFDSLPASDRRTDGQNININIARQNGGRIYLGLYLMRAVRKLNFPSQNSILSTKRAGFFNLTNVACMSRTIVDKTDTKRTVLRIFHWRVVSPQFAAIKKSQKVKILKRGLKLILGPAIVYNIRNELMGKAVINRHMKLY